MISRSRAQPWARRVARTVAVVAATVLAPWALADSLRFQDAVARAVEHAPQIARLASKSDAASQLLRSAGELPDPKVSLGVENLPVSGPDRLSLTRDFMTMQRVALMQDVPNRAKREARVAGAAARFAATQAERAVATRNAGREAALAWIRRRTLERQIEHLGRLFEENALFEAAVRAQVAGGRSGAADAVAPRQEHAMLEERRDQLVTRRTQAVEALRRWIGDAADLPLAGETPTWTLSRASLVGAIEQHPELTVVAAMGRGLEAEVREAISALRPDWSVGVAYARRGPGFGDMVSLQVAFDLPIFGERRQDPRIAAARSELQAIEAERESVHRALRESLASELAELERVERARERLANTLAPLARSKVELALAAYRAGRASLGEVIASRRERIETELRQIELDGEVQRVATSLHFTYGNPDRQGQAL